MTIKPFSSLVATFTGYLLFVFAASSIAQSRNIPLYSGKAPGSESWTWTEKITMAPAPMSASITYNVSSPSLDYYPIRPMPNNGITLLIIPGGGFHVLNTDNEGARIARYFNAVGINCYVLKYRLVQSLTDSPWQEMMSCMQKDAARHAAHVEQTKLLAMDDLKKALEIVRTDQAFNGLPPGPNGVIGFSAGGVMITRLLAEAPPELMPQFAAIIYAGLLQEKFAPYTGKLPPLFMAGATDDTLLPYESMLRMYRAYKEAGNSVELHLYAGSNHGLRPPPSNTWMERFTDWMRLQKILPQQ